MIMKDPEYIGCFRNECLNIDRNLHFQSPESSSLKVCTSACRESRFSYAGKINGTECVCSGAKPNCSSSSIDWCGIPCSEDLQSICGGGRHTSVYKREFKCVFSDLILIHFVHYLVNDLVIIIQTWSSFHEAQYSI